MELETYLPKLEDLWFRKTMLEDEETMSYNHAWGGTVSFPKDRWNDWYQYWVIEDDGQRYYRYLKNEKGVFVGEIAYHYSDFYHGYMANIIIYSKYRHQGYGREGLKILCEVAKENGITYLYDDIAIDNPAISLFLKEGFVEEYRTEEIILLKKQL
ncbi:MAG: GNAT family N-acetyltransferase [Bacilli bacterium]|nr:GNAT family N-acetyltransferase [Bacilli bacterium]